MPNWMDDLMPGHFKTDDHYWNAFDHHETEVSARWVVRFLQERGQGWADFTIAEIREFYARKRKASGGHDDGFTFNLLTESSRRVVSARGNYMAPNEPGISVSPRTQYGRFEDTAICTILPHFVNALVKANLMKRA